METHSVALFQIFGLMAKQVPPQGGVHKFEGLQQAQLPLTVALSVAQDLKQPETHAKAQVLQPAGNAKPLATLMAGQHYKPRHGADLRSNSLVFDTFAWLYCTTSLNRKAKALRLTCRHELQA